MVGGGQEIAHYDDNQRAGTIREGSKWFDIMKIGDLNNQGEEAGQIENSHYSFS